MSDTPETLAAVLAEMRAGIHTGRADIIDIVNERLIAYADRIEAAAERERNAHTNDIHDALYMATGIPGNVAAMREALNRVGHLANDLRNITERDTEVRADVNEIVDVCRAALATPARNCDRQECKRGTKHGRSLSARARECGRRIGTPRSWRGSSTRRKEETK